MKLVTLGTGTLVPDAERASAGYALIDGADYIAFDLGRGVVQRMCEHGIEPLELSRLHFSHFHPDHSCDLIPLLFAMNYAPEPPRTLPLQIVGPEGLEEFFEGICAVWPWLRPEFPVELVERGTESWTDRGLQFHSFLLSHGDRPNLGYRVESKNGSLAYTGDTGPCDALLSLASGVDILVSECSYPDSRARAKHLSPTPLAEAASAAGVGTLVVSHVYPSASGTEHAEILAQLRACFDGEIFMAYDGFTIEF
jgi:ribonuclease BN (tRNA processing enzyme)